MAKDPAFLFYYQDFLVGVDDFTNEEIGAYVKCLCIQAAKGGITEKHMKNICNSHEVHNNIKKKFILDETDNLLKNTRLRIEVEKRKKYTQSRASNRIGKKKEPQNINNISKTYEKHMENENEINIIIGIIHSIDNTKPQEILKIEAMVVLEMMKIWMKYNPEYMQDKYNDYPACLNFAYKIAEKKGWKNADVLNGKMPDTLKSWEKIVEFIAADNFYSTMALMSLGKHYQSIFQKMVKTEKSPKKTSYSAQVSNDIDEYMRKNNL